MTARLSLYFLSATFIFFLSGMRGRQAHKLPTDLAVFPKPSGEYLVGHLDLTYERAVPGKETRQLNTWVFIPAKNVEATTRRKYLSDERLLTAMKELGYLRFSKDTLDSWAHINTNSFTEAVPVDQRFPIVFILHGRGSSKINYTSLAEEICSHGYVVAMADHPHSGLTVLRDGSVVGLANPADLNKEVTEMSADICFLKQELLKNDILSKMIDEENIAMIGHSLGSMGVFNIALNNCGFRTGINLDGYPYGEAVSKGVNIPHLTIWGELPTHLSVSVDTLNVRRYATWRNFLKASNKDFILLKAKGMYHTDFNDLIFLRSPANRMRNPGSINSQRGYKIVCDVTVSYLDYRLKDRRKQDLLNLIESFPELSRPIKSVE
jgi:predicted esterase